MSYDKNSSDYKNLCSHKTPSLQDFWEESKTNSWEINKSCIYESGKVMDHKISELSIYKFENRMWQKKNLKNKRPIYN